MTVAADLPSLYLPWSKKMRNGCRSLQARRSTAIMIQFARIWPRSTTCKVARIAKGNPFEQWLLTLIFSSDPPLITKSWGYERFFNNFLLEIWFYWQFDCLPAEIHRKEDIAISMEDKKKDTRKNALKRHRKEGHAGVLALAQ